jgi:hypothetical protein
LKEALEFVPEKAKKVFLRSDTAGYVVALLKYCAEGKNERLTVIEYLVGTDVTEAFKRTVSEVAKFDWRRLPGRSKEATRRDWAEVRFVPHWPAGIRPRSCSERTPPAGK